MCGIVTVEPGRVQSAANGIVHFNLLNRQDASVSVYSKGAILRGQTVMRGQPDKNKNNIKNKNLVFTFNLYHGIIFLKHRM